MKLKYFLLAILTLPLVSCNWEMITEPHTNTYYIYVNNTSDEITLKAYHIDKHDSETIIDANITIAAGEEATLEFYDTVTRHPQGNIMSYPFGYNGGYPYNWSYVTVSNKDKIFTQYLANDDALFLIKSYEYSSVNDGVQLRYTFTDADFENATPVTE